MPQNTPMKRQFTTIDGRTVMSNLPQHWGGNDWTITGVDNPLPVGNYVQTEAGVWIPQKGSDDGAADVRLTGSIVELNKEVYDSQSRSVIITPGSYYNLLSHAYYPFKEIRGHLRWHETPSDYRLMLYYRVSEISFGLFENVELTGERTEFQFDLSGGHFELRLYNESTEDAYLRLFEVVGVV